MTQALIPYDYAEMSIMWSSLILLTLLTIYHTNTTYKAWKIGEVKLRWISLMFCSFIVLFFGISFAIYGIFHGLYQSIFNADNSIYCHALKFLLTNIYGCFKGISWLSLVLRLKESFQGSLVTYSNKFYLFWSIFIILYAVFIQILAVSIIKMKFIDGTCKGNVSLYIYAAMLIGDFFICFTNLYLFIKPLHTLNTLKTTSKIIIKSHALKAIIRKNAVLGSVSMISTIVVWIILALTGGKYPMMYQSLDCVITSYCIMLLFRWNKSLFNRLCCCILLWIDGDKNVQGIEINISPHSPVNSNSSTAGKTPTTPITPTIEVILH